MGHAIGFDDSYATRGFANGLADLDSKRDLNIRKLSVSMWTFIHRWITDGPPDRWIDQVAHILKSHEQITKDFLREVAARFYNYGVHIKSVPVDIVASLPGVKPHRS